MKSIFIIAACLLLSASFLIYSCTKNQSQTASVDKKAASGSTVPDDMLDAAKEWHATQTKMPAPLSINTVKSKGILIPLWDKAKIEIASNGITYIVVPTDKSKFNTTTLGVVRKFAFEMDGTKVVSARIIETYGMKNYIESNKDNLTEHYINNQTSNFSLSVITYDVNYKYLSSAKYENGLMIKCKVRIGPSPDATSKNSALRTEGCSDWYLTTWYDDGSITVDYLYTDCSGGSGENLGGGDGGGGGGGTGTGSSNAVVTSVSISLTDPCKYNALSAITNNKLQNFVSQFYNNYLVGSDSKFSLVIKEGPDIISNGVPVPAYTTPLGNNTWEITLSTTYYSAANGYNMSQQAWGEVIAHEIIHVAILANNLNTGGNDHAMMYKNFIDPLTDLLKDAFGMTQSDALGLALSGMNDLWGYSDFDQLMFDTYGVHTSDVQAILDSYTKGAGGTKC